MTWLAFSVTYLTQCLCVLPCCNLYYCFFHFSFQLKIGTIEHRIHFLWCGPTALTAITWSYTHSRRPPRLLCLLTICMSYLEKGLPKSFSHVKP